MKLRRILAFIIDWNLYGLPAMIGALIFRESLKKHELTPIAVVLFMLIALSLPTLVILRDVLFNGRSIAKRIFRFYIVEKGTEICPPKSKLAIRNLFVFIYPIDLIVLLITGCSIGDIATDTAVIRK